MKKVKQFSTATQERHNVLSSGKGEKHAQFSALPPKGMAKRANELPLSNKLISVRDHRKMASKDTEGKVEIYPSMMVRKRDRSAEEQDYYDMVARYGKKGRAGGSVRGSIDHFSNAARFRMLKKLGSIGREDPPFMVTLTYRAGTVSFEQAKKDLKKWRSRMDREFGIAHEISEPFIRKDGLPSVKKRKKYEATWAGSWRFEVTTGRGTRAKGTTPHFHILVWCSDWYDKDMIDLDHTLSKMWCEVTGDGGEDRMRYGCRIDKSGGDQTKIKNYMLGHHGKKTDQEATGAGRHWGILNEELLLIGQPTKTYHMNAAQRRKYDRITAKLIAGRVSNGQARDLSDLSETHVVLSPYQIHRIMKYLGCRESLPGEVLNSKNSIQMLSA